MRRLPSPTAGLAACLALTVAGGVAGAVAHASARSTTVVIRHPAPVTRPATTQVDRTTRVPTVAPLRRLTAPDVVVRVPHPATAAQLRRLRHRPGILAATAVDTGQVRLHGRRLAALGVDPSTVRGFTPALTARSDALWASVARGEVTVGYGAVHRLRHRLGDVFTVRHHDQRLPLRLGAFAVIGIGHASVLVDHTTGLALHLQPARRVLVSAPRLSLARLTADVRRVLGPHAEVHDARPQPPSMAPVSAFATASIPASYLDLYRAAAGTCPGLSWTVLAGIGAVETGHGADLRTSSKGAEGPMQFLPSTFAEYAVDGDRDGKADIHDPADAVYSAARMLCWWGAGRGGSSLHQAIWGYNHSRAYVREVLQYAAAYR